VKKKILILGGSGFVGRYLMDVLNPRDYLATYNRTQVPHAVHFDSVSMSLEDIVLDPNNFSHAVLLIGDTSPNSCARDMKRSNELNVHSLYRLLDLLKKWNIRPIFTSSESVYDGKRGDYSEEDSAQPILTYGRQKYDVEKYIRARFTDYVILRLARVIGDKVNDGSLLSDWLEDFKTKEVIKCATDQRFSPIYIGDVVSTILWFIDHNESGTFNISCGKEFTRIELLEKLLSHLQRVKPLDITIERCLIKDFPWAENTPLNLSMQSHKFVRTTRIKLTDMDQVCENIVKEYIHH